MADEENDKREHNHRKERGRFAGRDARAQPREPAQPTTQARPARDPFAEHVDSYVFSTKPGDKKLRFLATFVHCGQAMSERPTQMTVSLNPEKPSQGVRARLKCDVCGWKLRIEMVPENGDDNGET
jgi:hypothetical protein